MMIMYDDYLAHIRNSRCEQLNLAHHVLNFGHTADNNSVKLVRQNQNAFVCLSPYHTSHNCIMWRFYAPPPNVEWMKSLTTWQEFAEGSRNIPGPNQLFRFNRKCKLKCGSKFEEWMKRIPGESGDVNKETVSASSIENSKKKRRSFIVSAPKGKIGICNSSWKKHLSFLNQDWEEKSNNLQPW